MIKIKMDNLSKATLYIISSVITISIIIFASYMLYHTYALPLTTYKPCTIQQTIRIKIYNTTYLFGNYTCGGDNECCSKMSNKRLFFYWKNDTIYDISTTEERYNDDRSSNLVGYSFLLVLGLVFSSIIFIIAFKSIKSYNQVYTRIN